MLSVACKGASVPGPYPRIAISASFKAAHRKLLLLADQRATRGFLLFPALAVVFRGFALGQLEGQHLDCSLGQNAGFLAFAAAGTGVRMHRRQQHRMAVRTRIVHQLEGDRLVDCRAHAVAHVATQAQEVEAGLLVDQHREPHAGLADVGELAIERAGRAGLDAGDVVAHLAGDAARLEIRRPGGDVVAQPGEFQGVERAIAHA